MHLPGIFIEQSNSLDQVCTVGENMVVLLNRSIGSERSHLHLNRHVISFGLEECKISHSASGDVTVKSGEAVFLQKVLEKETYQAIAFFLMISFWLPFIKKTNIFSNPKVYILKQISLLF